MEVDPATKLVVAVGVVELESRVKFFTSVSRKNRTSLWKLLATMPSAIALPGQPEFGMPVEAAMYSRYRSVK